MRLIPVALIACGLLCPAQDLTDLLQKAPPDVENPLRERLKQFYQAHVDRKLRLADAVVAEESRDHFFEIDKPQYFSFDIVTLKYSDNFTKAQAVVAVEIEWKHPRAGKLRVKQPITSNWKLENGQWWWYFVPAKEHPSAFGTMKPGADREGGLPLLDGFKGVGIGDVLTSVRLSANEVRLKSFEPSSAEIVLTNGLPGNMSFRLQPVVMKGFQVAADKQELGPKEQARIRFNYKPEDRYPKPSAVLKIHIEQTNQTLPVTVVFELAPEHQKFQRAQ